MRGEPGGGDQHAPAAAAPDGIGGTGVDAGLLEALLPHLAESLMVLDAEWNVRANLAPPGGLIGRGLGLGLHTLEDMHPDDALRIMDLGVQAFTTEPGWEGSTVVRMQRGDGTYGRYEVTATNRFGDPVVDGMVVRTREVAPDTDHRTPGLEDRLTAELAELLPTGVVVLDGHARPVYVNGAACGILRHEPEDVKRRGLAAFAVADDVDRVDAALARVTRVAGREVVLVGVAGERVVECRLSSFGDPDVTAVIATLEDVTVRHQAEERLVHRADHDELTGLRNRASVLDLLRSRIDDDVPTVVAYLDLDGFKHVNDSGGHSRGDRLLVSVARSLERGLGDGVVVGRIGGDEFVAVLAAEGADAVAARARSVVADAGAAHGVAIDCSVGLARVGPGDGPRSVLHRADEAMYRDKRARRALPSGAGAPG